MTAGRGGSVSPAGTAPGEASYSMPGPAGRAIRGGVAGNYVDQFDIFLPVVALAPAAAWLFGPSDLARNTGLVFVATLLGRPLGASLFGPVADRIGRTATTRITVAGVALTTALIGCVPGHDVLGELTFASVLVLRFLGGVFLGGEYTSAVPLAMEWSRPRRRGTVSGLIMSMSPWANASIALLTLGLLAALGPTSYAAWGWRLPFLLGGALAAAMFVYYSRVRDAEVAPTASAPAPSSRKPADVAAETSRRRSPLHELLFGPQRRALAQVFLLMSGLWLFTNMAIPVLTSQLKPSLGDFTVTTAMVVATVVSAFSMVATGVLSTRVGRRRFFVAFGAAALVLAPTAYLLARSATGIVTATLAVTAVQLVTVAVYGPIGAYLTERFPVPVRSTGYGVGYSLSIVLPALYPFFLPPLVAALGDRAAVVACLVLAAVCVTAGALLGPDPDVDAPLP